MKLSDNEVPEDTEGMFDEIMRMREHCSLTKATLSEKNMKEDPFSAFVALAYVALRQKEMWKDALDEVNNDLKRSIGKI